MRESSTNPGAINWNALIEEAAASGLGEDQIGPSVGRPLSSVAKLIDEWLYMTITAGVR